MTRKGKIGLLVSAAALLCGCASKPMDTGPSLVQDNPPPPDAATSGYYQLSSKELDYDCKKLTGVMQIRILQIRGYEDRKKTSGASRALQSVTTPIFGGTTQGMDPDGQYRRDRAMLDAYNVRLAQKGCKTYDIDAELKKSDLFDTPRPTDKKAQ